MLLKLTMHMFIVFNVYKGCILLYYARIFGNCGRKLYCVSVTKVGQLNLILCHNCALLLYSMLLI